MLICSYAHMLMRTYFHVPMCACAHVLMRRVCSLVAGLNRTVRTGPVPKRRVGGVARGKVDVYKLRRTAATRLGDLPELIVNNSAVKGQAGDWADAGARAGDRVGAGGEAKPGARLRLGLGWR